jgi:hypothetical protein
MKRGRLALFAIILLLVSSVAINGCFSPAPGCNKGIGMGGCFSTFAIKDITIDPKLDCIKFHINNCNNPTLGIINRCGKDIFFEGEKIPYNYEVYYLSLRYIEPGNYPLCNTTPILTGYVEGTPFNITCEPYNQQKNNYRGNISIDISEDYKSCLDVTGCWRAECPRDIERIYTHCKNITFDSLNLAETKIDAKEILFKESTLDTGNTPGYPGSKSIASYDKPPLEDTKYSYNINFEDKNYTLSYTLTKSLC